MGDFRRAIQIESAALYRAAFRLALTTPGITVDHSGRIVVTSEASDAARETAAVIERIQRSTFGHSEGQDR